MIVTSSSAQPDWYRETEAPWGARWVRCALHVNPYAYAVRHASSVAADEEAYNRDLVSALVGADIELIAITDHYRVKDGVALAQAAREAGITVLLGFEAATSEGVHMLCIFDEQCGVDIIDRRIGSCGVEPDSGPSPVGKLDALALMAQCRAWSAACIAAHATHDNGILKHLRGQPRINAWTSNDLHAVAIPGAIAASPQQFRNILSNSDAKHRRQRSVAVLNAADISKPTDLARPGATCRLKLSELSLDALRQAFLDPELRVRLDSDSDDRARPSVRAIHWEGGFLSGQTVQFADELNVLVGAPGSGKSTVVESLRATLGLVPASPRARADHEAIVGKVLGSQTTISVVVHYPTPSPTSYVVERTLPSPPRVLNVSDWSDSGLAVSDLQPALAIYGQHEVAELAEDSVRRTGLLERFVKSRPERAARLEELREGVARQRELITGLAKDADATKARLSLLPGQEEKLKRYDEAGVAAKLETQTQLDREQRVVKKMRSELDALDKELDRLHDGLPLEPVAESNRDVAASPFLPELERLDTALAAVSTSATLAVAQLRTEISQARVAADDVFAAWKERRANANDELLKVKQELKDKDIDDDSYRALRASIDELVALRPGLKKTETKLAAARRTRSTLLHEHEGLLAEQVRDFQKAAAQVTTELSGTVRVTTTSAPDLAGVKDLLTEGGGRLAEALQLFSEDAAFSPRELGELMRKGKTGLRRRWTLSDTQADRLAQMGPAIALSLEELEPHVMTQVELNVSQPGEDPRWQTLDQLSKGQKATAILLLLLLDSDAPLVVDQPEDDLDNRFIADRVVPRIRTKKSTRQFLFSTHNANVPVLADAELIVGLTASGDSGGHVHAEVLPGHRGSIDTASVRHLIEERLEGGRAAFQERQRKYGL